MAHLASILFFFGLLTGLAVLLEQMVREHGPAIRKALSPPPPPAASSDSALSFVGACLRASFPSGDLEALDPDLGRLLRQLTGDAPARAQPA